MYASFYCNVGLKLYGSNSLRCLRNGDWDLPMPICIDSGCAHPGKIVNGFQKDYESFSIITYQCYDGYLLKGSSLIYCDGATWNDTVPECVRSTARVSSAPLYNCHDPGEVDNAVRNDDPLHGTISYICIGDYKLLGSQVIECQFNKKWSSSKPTCAKKGCVELSVPMNASVIPIYDGAAMLYQCDSGYEIIGSTIIYCDGRNWNDSIPQCVHLKSESDRTHNVAVPRPSGVSDNENDSLFRIDDGMRCDFTNVRQPNSGYGIITKRDSYGSFYRVVKYFCAEGYKLIGGDLELICTHGKWVGDFPVCSPDDPCVVNNGGCEHKCKNINGQVQCECNKGYELKNGIKCIDINECLDGKGHGPCQHSCTNTNGGYSCSCFTGHILMEDGINCQVLPCEDDNGGCSHICTNDDNQAVCSCYRGYYIDQADGKTCIDLNECSLQQFSRRCSFGCENTYGSFRCTCPRGFITAPNGIQCLDINECLIEGTCHHNCINLPGSYQCTCHDGYLIMPDGKTCDGCRINSFKSSSTNECIECPRNSHTKGTGKTSLNDCVCNSGFTGDPGNGINCQDINECQTDNFGCSDNCVNTPGSAYCVCNVGYRLENEKVCIDIDECSLGNGGCEHTCNNTDGSFACTCKDGYIIDPLDPYLCADIDECLHNNGGCDQRCVNYPGGYLCECDGASIVDDDRKTCKPVVCSALAIPARGRVKPRGKCTGSNPDTLLEVGTECVFDCLKGYELEGSDRRICEPNGRWSGSETSCKPVYCPAIVPPENGRLLPASCQNSQSPYQSQCVFTCDEGYRLSGPRITKCLFNKKWNSRDREPMCIKDVQEPVITCSPDVTVDLDQGNSTAIVSIPTPVYEHGSLRVNRPTHNAPFPAGTTLVYFTVVSDEDEKKAANCTTKVNVIDKEPPKVLHCPESMFVETAEQYPTDIQWEDATFTDNVGIKDILPFFRNPGGTLTWGIHHIKYIAKDAANNAAECSFNIVIEPKSCGLPDGPLNGVPDCVDWLYGEICNPTCNEGYVFYEGTAKSVYVCGVDAKWSPSRQLPDCTEYSNLGSNGVCPPGTELKSYEQFEEEVCVTCPRGMYMPQNETTCIACQLGYYQDEFGSTDCKLCPSGFTTYHNSSIDLSDCKAAVITTEAYGKSDPDVTKSTPVTHYITETYDDKKK
uniref:Sushi, von Willebrand factor type A, EGF and pentraxin domain-containing protein 1-like n=1 Tax=Saccoglossus kowalevskii TaxID=10224 RepID=A0ABM0M9B7_SACKO|nr:PREDICTED: sushi, von Willebrand factor type A, EGF and pentraxin domain-containing protein 1-like [Saccoglossus kowalevskii]